MRSLNAEVAAANLAERSLELSDGQTLTGSHLVMAAGARPNFFGVPGAEEHAFPLYSVADAERLRLHLQDLLQAARSGAGDEPGLLDVVVVGGGPTGVETTGALAELMQALQHDGSPETPGQITIVDRGSALLGAFSEKAHKYVAQEADRGRRRRPAEDRRQPRSTRTVSSSTTAARSQPGPWSGAVASPARRSPQTAGPSDRPWWPADVLPDLTVDGFPGVYAVGDVANIPAGDDARQGPAAARVGRAAVGRWAAENILREQRGEPTEPFAYKDKGIMAMIGRNAAVAEVGKHRHQVEGPVAFAAWLGVHAMLLSGAHSKTDAFLTWAWDYFDRDHAATVEASSAAARGIAWGDDEEDVPHISLDEPAPTPPRPQPLRRHHGRRLRRDHRGIGCRWRHPGAPAGTLRQAGADPGAR